MSNNWSPDLQTWCNLLNTLISQAHLTPDEFVDASPLHHRSNASSTPHSRSLFQSPPAQPSYPLPYHYPPYPYPAHPISGSSGGNTPTPYPYSPPPPYPYPAPPVGGSSGGSAHPPYSYPPPQLVVRWVVLLINHIHTLHLRHIHTLHLNLFTPEVVTTRVERITSPIQLKLRQG
jgi:hypothetical protein